MEELRFYSVYAVLILWAFQFYQTGLFRWIMPVFFFVLIPILEFLDIKEKREVIDSNKFYRNALCLWILPHILMLFLGILTLSENDFTYNEFASLCVNTGLMTGIVSFNVAHELIHKSNRLEKMLGRFLLVTLFQGHFEIEHLFGHHKRLARDDDCSTAKINQSVYNFCYESIKKRYAKSWRLARIYNRTHLMILYHLCEAIFISEIIQYFGFWSTMFVIIQAFIAIIIANMVNYIGHYGIVRDSKEKVDIHHSWNADSYITNCLTFKVQRHSDHHINSNKSYEQLNDFDHSPRLPTGYAGCILLSLIPFLWYRVMNKRLKKYTQ